LLRTAGLVLALVGVAVAGWRAVPEADVFTPVIRACVVDRREPVIRSSG